MLDVLLEYSCTVELYMYMYSTGLLVLRVTIYWNSVPFLNLIPQNRSVLCADLKIGVDTGLRCMDPEFTHTISLANAQFQGLSRPEYPPGSSTV